MERRLPEWAREDLVVAHIGDAPRRTVVLEEHEAPIQIDELALAVSGFATTGA